MEGSWALRVALGHVRCAVVAFVGAEDPSGESLFLAADCLEVEGLFADLGVEPEPVDPSVDGVASLDAASEALAAARPVLPLAVWAGLQAVRARAAR